VQILYNSYLPHPDSDLDVPQMNLDLLDEIYPIFNLYFMAFDYTGLTGQTRPANFGANAYTHCFNVIYNYICNFYSHVPPN
jgi:hypothetical protein